MKKVFLLLIAMTVVFSFTATDYVDAKPRSGSFKSGKKSFTDTPSQSSNVNKSDSGTKSSNKSTSSSSGTTNRGFFSGGSLMKGLMIGGLAGLLFGGMFSNMGFLGDMLGLFINILAIYIIIMVIHSIYKRFTQRKAKPYPDPNERVEE
ncbi:hypothetical protein [Marinicrinis lubricantis]|uniref:Preprotein translocase subunit Tim44 n=1 Tax=Marinicrinis lubricantis TaxID=2086470 RepID=A0ABW1IL06_9BACL